MPDTFDSEQFKKNLKVIDPTDTQSISRLLLESALLLHNGKPEAIITSLAEITQQEVLNRLPTPLVSCQELEGEVILYRDIFERSIHPLLITGLEGNITNINPAFEKLYGYSKMEVVGKNPSILNPGEDVYKDHGIHSNEIFKNLWQSVEQTGSAVTDVINKGKNGALKWVSLTIFTMRDRKGNPVGYVGMPIDIQERMQNEESIRINFYQTLTNAAELRDNETGKHMLRVGLDAEILAKQLGMGAKFCRDIRTFAPWHDIGKIGITDMILLKPEGLTDAEFRTMQTHTTLAKKIFKGQDHLRMAEDIASGHHEKWNGDGYPCGLKGSEIPLSAQITAVSDVYDALRSKRPYKKPWEHQRAVEEIQAGRERHFAPDVVDAFVAAESDMEKVSREMAD